MAGEQHDFRVSAAPEPHHARTRAILDAHPEVRRLIGRNPWSFAVIAGGVALQLGLAWALRDGPWWALLAVAWCVGAFVNHAMYVMIHEATHDLIFPRRWQNRAAAILADLVNVVPAAISFRSYHLKHHAHQGVYELDADLPSRWEAKLIGSGPLGKALWLLFFPLFQATRPPRLKAIRFLDRWTVANWATTAAVDGAILLLWGPGALLYLLASFFFSVGLHPLGARWIQEHYLTDDPQETYSYYGAANLVAMNVGYHNEHHDFPSVPWNRLPRLKATAPEFYDSMVYHGSWTGLLARWILDRDLSLYSRMTRETREGARDLTQASRNCGPAAARRSSPDAKSAARGGPPAALRARLDLGRPYSSAAPERRCSTRSFSSRGASWPSAARRTAVRNDSSSWRWG